MIEIVGILLLLLIWTLLLIKLFKEKEFFSDVMKDILLKIKIIQEN